MGKIQKALSEQQGQSFSFFRVHLAGGVSVGVDRFEPRVPGTGHSSGRRDLRGPGVMAECFRGESAVRGWGYPGNSLLFLL